jgi:gamma-glutamylcyclotransferase (GGCT)/AIG2-like uncharacterized protein YtfP
LYQANSIEGFNWAIIQLDDYEGLNVEQGETPLYTRKIVEVYKEGQQSLAWIYWYNQSVEGMEEIKTGDIMKYLQDQNKPHHS